MICDLCRAAGEKRCEHVVNCRRCGNPRRASALDVQGRCGGCADAVSAGALDPDGFGGDEFRFEEGP